MQPLSCQAADADAHTPQTTSRTLDCTCCSVSADADRTHLPSLCLAAYAPIDSALTACHCRTSERASSAGSCGPGGISVSCTHPTAALPGAVTTAATLLGLSASGFLHARSATPTAVCMHHMPILWNVLSPCCLLPHHAEWLLSTSTSQMYVRQHHYMQGVSWASWRHRRKGAWHQRVRGSTHQPCCCLDQAQRALPPDGREGLPHLPLDVERDDARADALARERHVAGGAPRFDHAVVAVGASRGRRRRQRWSSERCRCRAAVPTRSAAPEGGRWSDLLCCTHTCQDYESYV